MTYKTLNQLISPLKPITITGSLDTAVHDITNDSRQVKKGSVFVAVKGYSMDGNRYIQNAVEAGAAAVVTDNFIPNLAIPQIVVENTREAQALMACEFFDHPSRSLKIAGVTGTNGKTTSSFMIDGILQSAGLHTGLTGTLYNKINGSILPTINTTPDSILCQRLLRDMVSAGATHVSMEVSSHAMVMHRVDGTIFTVGGITNFTPDHLDLHPNMSEYMLAKRQFFQMLPQRGTAIVNLDDPGCHEITRSTPADLLWYSLTNPKADIYLRDYQHRGKGAVIAAQINAKKIATDTDIIYFYLGIPGRHNISNALLATATALTMGIDSASIAKGLGSFRGIFRRFETIYNGKYRVIDDATHNPGNMDAVFSAVEEQADALTIVYAIRGNRGVSINQSIAATLRGWSQKLKLKRVIITSCEDTAGPLDKVAPDEEQVFRTELAGLKTDIQYYNTLRDALSLAVDSVQKGETLLLMGAHPMDHVSDLFSELSGIETTTLPRPPRFGIH